MKRTILACALALVTPLSAQRAAPPRPVGELRLLLARFNNGTVGFSEDELKHSVIGFAQAARDGEFAVVYFVDRGDNAIHPPLHLAFSRSGQPWRRNTIAQPAEKIGSSSVLFIGSDYLLATSLTMGTETPRQHLLVFSKDLSLKFAVDGGLDLEPFPNGSVLFHSTTDFTAPALRADLRLLDTRTGTTRLLYPGPNQGRPSAGYQKLLPELVQQLNAQVRHGNMGRGYRTEWYAAVRRERPQFNPVRDELTFTLVIAPTWPIPPVPGVKSRIEMVPVTCAPMHDAAAKCVEGHRTISVWPLPK